MREEALFYLVWIVASLGVQAFFAMMEMAAVSFNKVRLQYYVSKGNQRARWLSSLLHSPGILFGTTLIGINTALQVGSECARRFYESIGLSPDFAPLSQVIIVLVFAEVAPLFSGRKYAEHAALLGAPFLYCFSLILRPLVWILDVVCRAVYRVMGIRQHSSHHLSREEIQKVFEEKEDEFQQVVQNIFSLKAKRAKEVMQPLSSLQMIPSVCSMQEMRALLTERYSPFVPIYHKDPRNIVAIAYPRDLLRQGENKKVREYSKSPWFITENDFVMDILKQFRSNNQSIAIVLGRAGDGVGFVTLDSIVDLIFGQVDAWGSFGDAFSVTRKILVDRTFSGDFLVSEFNRLFHVHLEEKEKEETLSQFFTRKLGHVPGLKESIRVDGFEWVAEEISLLGAKEISIRSVNLSQ